MEHRDVIDRIQLLEIELKHTINTLKILVDVLKEEGYTNTIKHITENINNATEILDDENKKHSKE